MPDPDTKDREEEVREGEDAHYVALLVQPGASINGRDVLLAARKSPDPEEHVVIALFDTEASALYHAGRLTGWKPTEDRLSTYSRTED